jgi:hypothetical protein
MLRERSVYIQIIFHLREHVYCLSKTFLLMGVLRWISLFFFFKEFQTRTSLLEYTCLYAQPYSLFTEGQRKEKKI